MMLHYCLVLKMRKHDVAGENGERKTSINVGLVLGSMMFPAWKH